MGSLSSSLSIATGALLAEQGALSATTNNVANANTPGYSRLVPVLVENDPVKVGSLTYGTGVSLQQLQGIRDPILQFRTAEETQQQGQLNSLVAGAQQVQVNFRSSSGDIGTQISNFFSSLDQLSTAPTSLASRQGVLTAAGNLAGAFNKTSNALSGQQSNLDLSVVQSVQQINALTSQIAAVNAQITSNQGLNQNPSAFIDKRDSLIGQLSSLIDIGQINSDGGLTLTTSNGSALVVGNQSSALTTRPTVAGRQDVFAQGNDITAQVTSGQLAGIIQVRDQQIPSVLSSLDTLASGLAAAVNTAHQAGFDLNGAAGGNLFVPPPVSGQGAAGSLAVAITDPALIAASSDGSPGSNGNVNVLSAVHDQAVAGGQTPSNAYGNIVFNVGNNVSGASAELSSSQLILQQLQDQRGSISGVSLDEEAANMVKFQRAYDAAAHVITTINDMLYTVINMGTLTG